MSQDTFDTLQWTKRAQRAGFTPSQAEFQAKTLARFCRTIATKQDLATVEKKFSDNLITAVRDLEERLTSKLTIRFGSMLAAAIVLIPILTKLTALIK